MTNLADIAAFLKQRGFKAVVSGNALEIGVRGPHGYLLEFQSDGWVAQVYRKEGKSLIFGPHTLHSAAEPDAPAEEIARDMASEIAAEGALSSSFQAGIASIQQASSILARAVGTSA